VELRPPVLEAPLPVLELPVPPPLAVVLEEVEPVPGPPVVTPAIPPVLELELALEV
jgi:hypothetical protein